MQGRKVAGSSTQATVGDSGVTLQNTVDDGSVENEECGVRGASVENAECGKCGVWKMRGVENVNIKLASKESNSFIFSLKECFIIL